ncbi:MAG: hypothetical protein J7K68_06210 [Candidatus Diapherotrites archaeon]|nr:hypothetical protein [Candidatus Diapherotrites archaeon]
MDEKHIYKMLTKREFRRAWPFLPETLKQRIRESIMLGNPLKLVGMWGGHKESKTGMADYSDVLALDNIYRMTKEIPTNVEIIFCDKHSIVINGRTKFESNRYYFSLLPIVSHYGFKITRLSDIYESSYNIKIDDTLVSKFIPMAKKHARIRAEKAAERYLKVRISEKKTLEKRYSDAVFFTYSPPEMQFLMPTLPTLYIYSIKRGVSECPWFMEMPE